MDTDNLVTQISQIQQITFIFDHGFTRIDTDNLVTQISQIQQMTFIFDHG